MELNKRKRGEYAEAMIVAVDLQDTQQVRELIRNPSAGEETPSLETRHMCFDMAVAHENDEIIDLLMSSGVWRPYVSLLHTALQAAVEEGTRPQLIYTLQQHATPQVLSEHHRNLEEIRHTGRVKDSAYYLVDLKEEDNLRIFNHAVDKLQTNHDQISRSVYLRSLLKNQAWINDSLFDAVESRHKLLLNRILRLSGSIRPSQNAVNSAFKRALLKDIPSVAFMLAAGGDHVAVARNGWSCVDRNGYDEAFEAAVDMDDVESLAFLMTGRLGFRPEQDLIDIMYKERELEDYNISLNSRSAPRTAGGVLSIENVTEQRSRVTLAMLSRQSSAECHGEIFDEKKIMRKREELSLKRAQVFRPSQGVDIHAYARGAVAAPTTALGLPPQPDTAGRGRGQSRLRNSLNDVILANIEQRISSHRDMNVNYNLHDATTVLTALIMRTFESPDEQNSAVRIIGDVLTESTLPIFGHTLTFLRVLATSEEDETRLLNIWMHGFLSESIVMHSCNPGAVERVVTGLRGIGDPQLDTLFGQAEGPHLARAFLKGTLNIFYDDTEESKQRATSNARNLAKVLVEQYRATPEISDCDVMNLVVRYASDSVASYGVNISAYESDIREIAEMIADNCETHLVMYIRELCTGDIIND